MDSERIESNSENSGIRDIPEVGIGLGLAMGHLTGVLNESNMLCKHNVYSDKKRPQKRDNALK
jgi:hypothetical protein